MKSRFDSVSGPLLEALRAGSSWSEACRVVDVSAYTAKSWLQKGRQEPDGRYARFALDVEAAREVAEASAPGREAPLTVEEVMAHLARAVRAGSVTAMKAWLDRYDRERLGGAEGDGLEAFDELAKRRGAAS